MKINILINIIKEKIYKIYNNKIIIKVKFWIFKIFLNKRSNINTHNKKFN